MLGVCLGVKFQALVCDILPPVPESDAQSVPWSLLEVQTHTLNIAFQQLPDSVRIGYAIEEALDFISGQLPV